jgi:hypothetical protein
LLILYGPPDRDYLAKWCGIWEVQNSFPWFPASHILINIDFKTKLFAAFQQLEKAGIHTEIKTYDGCYNDRSVRGKDTTSLHAWAAAMDLNAKDNPMTMSSDPKLRHGTWSPLFIQIMIGAGIYFGGNWHSRADPMHWALFNG